jgi:calcineurin-like phosphoesterase family protein
VRHLLNFRAWRRTPKLPDGLRIYAIGDIHGRADLLGRMFAAIDADLARYPSAHALNVFLGDYIDRGPASRRVIDLLINHSCAHEVVFLRGNHETYVPQFLEDPAVLGRWRMLGGLETLMSYGLNPSFNAHRDEQHELANRFAAALPQNHVLFFGRLQSSFCCGDFFFVHAGVKPGVPVEQQREEDLLWIRDEFLLHQGSFGKMIVHGHAPIDEPEFRDNRINIDTGAYATGKLTCLIIEHDELAILNVIV